jgi:hypothetical protein
VKARRPGSRSFRSRQDGLHLISGIEAPSQLWERGIIRSNPALDEAQRTELPFPSTLSAADTTALNRHDFPARVKRRMAGVGFNLTTRVKSSHLTNLVSGTPQPSSEGPAKRCGAFPSVGGPYQQH